MATAAEIPVDAAVASGDSDGPVPSPFPARSRTKGATISEIPTTVTSMQFSDKILLTYSQHGRLAHWIHVPLTPAPTADLTPSISTDPEHALLPETHITATTILGGTMPGLDTLGQTLATHLASAIMSANRDERRMLVLGLGFDRKMESLSSEDFAELVGAGLDVL